MARRERLGLDGTVKSKASYKRNEHREELLGNRDSPVIITHIARKIA
jgi:hypothetical protein